MSADPQGFDDTFDDTFTTWDAEVEGWRRVKRVRNWRPRLRFANVVEAPTEREYITARSELIRFGEW